MILSWNLADCSGHSNQKSRFFFAIVELKFLSQRYRPSSTSTFRILLARPFDDNEGEFKEKYFLEIFSQNKNNPIKLAKQDQTLSMYRIYVNEKFFSTAYIVHVERWTTVCQAISANEQNVKFLCVVSHMSSSLTCAMNVFYSWLFYISSATHCKNNEWI